MCTFSECSFILEEWVKQMLGGAQNAPPEGGATKWWVVHGEQWALKPQTDV